MINITPERLEEMCQVVKSYNKHDGQSWQVHAGLSGVGDITLITDPEQRLMHVNTKEFQRSEEGDFLIQVTRKDNLPMPPNRHNLRTGSMLITVKSVLGLSEGNAYMIGYDGQYVVLGGLGWRLDTISGLIDDGYWTVKK